MQKGELRSSAWAHHGLGYFLQDAFGARHCSSPITPIPPHGAKSAGAAPRAHADMSEWIMTNAIPGKRQKSGTARSKPRAGRTAVSDDPFAAPRAADGRAPDVFRPGGWIPMRQYRQDELVDFAIVGTGAGGGTLACRLAEHGFSVVAMDAGPYFRPLEDFASDESEQTKLYWTDDRIVDGANPLQMGSNNSGKAVGGSTVHFAMVSLRFRPEWFKSRSLLGYGADWPLDWREMWHYYAEVEDALKIAGPVTYPWGPHRPRYPLPGARAQCRCAGPCRRLRGVGNQMDGNADRHAFGSAWIGASLRLSRLLHDRLFDQRQAERARDLDSARDRCRRRNPRSRNGRQDRDRQFRPGDRRPLSSRRPVAVSARAQCRRRGLRDRNAATAAELGHRPFSGRARQQLRSGRQEPDGAVEPGRLGNDGQGGALLQGAAVSRHHRALELRGQRKGLLRRLLLHEPGPAAAAVGQHADERPRPVGHRA